MVISWGTVFRSFSLLISKQCLSVCLSVLYFMFLHLLSSLFPLLSVWLSVCVVFYVSFPSFFCIFPFCMSVCISVCLSFLLFLILMYFIFSFYQSVHFRFKMAAVLNGFLDYHQILMKNGQTFSKQKVKLKIYNFFVVTQSGKHGDT